MTDNGEDGGLPLSRRHFLAATGVLTVGALASACTTSPSPSVDSPSVPDSDALPPADLFEPLQPPTQFKLRPAANGSLQASWVGGGTADGRASYQLFIDGQRGPTTQMLSTAVPNLSFGPHAVAVATIDAGGTASRRTPESLVTVSRGTQTDTLPLVLEAVPAANSIQFRWSLEEGFDGAAIDSYRLRRVGDTRPVATTGRDGARAADTWLLANPIIPGLLAEYFVEAVDVTGKLVGRSVNSVRATSYYRAWPTSYPTPARTRTASLTRTSEGVTIAWENPDAVDVNIFADEKFLMQLRGSPTEAQLAPGESDCDVAVVAVSPWGRTSKTSIRAAVTAPRQGGFTTRDGRILDPDGRPFVPVGVNLSGPDYVWNESVVGTATKARDIWKMTAVRIDCGMRDWGAVAQGYLYFSNNNLDRIVSEYTEAGVVVILAQFNKGIGPFRRADDGGLLSVRAGSAPDGTGRSVEDATTDWWIEVARRYRDNPRVWINPINEPQNDIDGLADQYKRMLTRIRAVAPLTPLVLDAANFANDIPNDADIADGPIREVDSFVLRHGRSLVAEFGEPRGYGPVIFSIHVYSRWPRNYATNEILTDDKLAARMRDYVREARSRGLALLVGETGVEDWALEFDSASVRVGLYEQGSVNGVSTGVWPEQEVGVIAWHASPVSGMPISRKGSWAAVRDISGAAPPPDAGAGIWAYGHRVRP